MSEAEQIAQQAENLTAAWNRISVLQWRCDRLQARCDDQQGIIDWQRQRIRELEDPAHRAAAHFTQARG